MVIDIPSAEVEDGVVVRQQVYTDDLDGFGMLNHTRYAVLFDHAVLDFWRARGWKPEPFEAVPVIRELTLTYHQPVMSVGTVAIHLWVQESGLSSVTYRFRILSDDLQTLHAEGSRCWSTPIHRPCGRQVSPQLSGRAPHRSSRGLRAPHLRASASAS